MSNGNWRITGNENEGNNNMANKMNMNGTAPFGINNMDLARAIVEIEQKLERTLNSRMDVLQSQMAQFDRKLYFIEMKLDALNQFFGTEMPSNESNSRGGRANNRGKGGNHRYRTVNNSANNLQIFGGGGGNGHGRYGGEGDGPNNNGFEAADLTMEERLISEDFVPPALRFLFNQFSPQNEDGNTIRSTSSQRTTSLTTAAFYGQNNGNGGGGQHRRFTATSSANFSAQIAAAAIGFSNGPTFNGNEENGNGGGKRQGNGMEQRKLSNGNGGNWREQQMDGGFGQGRRGGNSMMRNGQNNHHHQQWSPLFLRAMAETKGQKGGGSGGGQIATAANRAAIKQKQTLGKNNNKIAEWTTRTQMGSYTVSEESEEEGEVDEEMATKTEEMGPKTKEDGNEIEEEKKCEDENEDEKVEDKEKNENEQKEEQIMNVVDGKHFGDEVAAKSEGTKIVGRRNSV